jgi:hypothetical protein
LSLITETYLEGLDAHTRVGQHFEIYYVSAVLPI